MISVYLTLSVTFLPLAVTIPLAEDSSAFPAGVFSFDPQPPSSFCKQFSGVPAANGTQLTGGGESCSSTTQGLIPDVNKMVSTLIVEPASGAKVDASVDNTVKIDTIHLVTGFFDLAATQYYMAPQTLDPATGFVQGHQHITVQKLDSVVQAPDPKIFAFFKGINDAATDPGKRTLTALIPAGTIKADGLYRICSMTGADSHQPVLMPVAQRGAQDDCIRVTFFNSAVASSGGNNGGNNGGNSGQDDRNGEDNKNDNNGGKSGQDAGDSNNGDNNGGDDNGNNGNSDGGDDNSSNGGDNNGGNDNGDNNGDNSDQGDGDNSGSDNQTDNNNSDSD